MAREVKAGSIWFVISMKWIEVAQKYLYLDYLTGNPQAELSDEERVDPGPVSNSDILLELPKG
jgi:hypothetical protein